jgi:hypothetical protein
VDGAEIEVIFASRPQLSADCAAWLDVCSCADELASTMVKLELAFTPLATAVTSLDGRFAITGLPSTNLEVRGWHSDRTYGTAHVALVGRADVELRLNDPLSDELYVANRSGTRVEGTSIFAIVDRQIVDFAVSELGQGHSLKAPMSAIRAYAPGYRLATPSPQSSDHSGSLLVLDRGWVLRGKIEVAGAPLANTAITARQQSQYGTDCVVGVTREDGSWTIEGAALGEYDLTARSGPRSGDALVSVDDPPPAIALAPAIAPINGDWPSVDDGPVLEVAVRFSRSQSLLRRRRTSKCGSERSLAVISRGESCAARPEGTATKDSSPRRFRPRSRLRPR